MKHIEIINGPNLNLTGIREPQVYGHTTMEQLLQDLRNRYPQVEIGYYQSNVEGLLIDHLQAVGLANPATGQAPLADGIILNAGGYSHTSVAIHDAIAAITTPVIEVHISNIFAREEYRRRSLLSDVCRGLICGLGLQGYRLALEAFLSDCIPIKN